MSDEALVKFADLVISPITELADNVALVAGSIIRLAGDDETDVTCTDC